jgi:glycosyltransferase involved in cell wall biosynthesis
MSDGDRKRPVCMLTHSYYEEDPRVRREARALVERGRPVDVYALRRPGDPAHDACDGVSVHRMNVQRHQGAGLGTYLREYVSFFVRAGLAATLAHPRRRYALIQVHTLPDFLVFAAAPLRLSGVPVVIDLHEAMPEFFRSRFPGASNSFVYGLLKVQERLSIAAADRAITVNDALATRLRDRGVSPDKITVVPNYPVLGLFDEAAHHTRTFMADGTLQLIYAGALTPMYELDVALDAVAEVRRRRPELQPRLAIYGRGDSEEALRTQATRIGLVHSVAFHGRIPMEEVPAAIASADIGLAPTRRDRYTNDSLSTKIFEYAAMRKAIVASRLPLVDRIFGQAGVTTYEPGNAASMADAILRLVNEPEERDRRVEVARAVVHRASWEIEADRYSGLIEELAPDGSSTLATAGLTARYSPADPGDGVAVAPSSREDA